MIQSLCGLGVGDVRTVDVVVVEPVNGEVTVVITGCVITEVVVRVVCA